MIDNNPSFEKIAAFEPQVAVIGGGPVGLVTAMALSKKGIHVLVLESGGIAPTQIAQSLSEAENLNPEQHHAPHITTSRRLGGASNLWGGRCVPFDPIDFQARPWLGLQGWPISEADIVPFLEAAVRMLDAGGADYRAPLAGVEADDAFSCDMLERWASSHRTHRHHQKALESDPALMIALGTTALGFQYDDAGRIASVDMHIEGAGRGSVFVDTVILAAGGNESTRLLLSEQRRHTNLFGAGNGLLGRNYMGHVNGQIADITITNRALADGLDFHTDTHGRYVRRRFVPSAPTQSKERIANVAFWPVVPRVFDAAHRSGPLSSVFLALATKPIGRRLISEAIRLKHVGEPQAALWPHLINILRDPIATMTFAPKFLWHSKIARPRLPGLFIKNPAGKYGLEYHSEHLPSADSRLTLSDTADRLGMPRLKIDLRFSDADAQSVVRAHEALSAWLECNDLGRLEYRCKPEDRATAVLAEAKHGNHQIGTIPMGADRATGIVDKNCFAFDVPNLAVISTAVLPTSGQANPTLTAVQLGLRLADRIAHNSSDRNDRSPYNGLCPTRKKPGRINRITSL